jgi:hypothetical protein
MSVVMLPPAIWELVIVLSISGVVGIVVAFYAVISVLGLGGKGDRRHRVLAEGLATVAASEARRVSGRQGRADEDDKSNE